MSANVETMFYVREVPWHGLGERVEEALNSKDALRTAGLDWTVDPKNVYTDVILNNEPQKMLVPNWVANVRSSDNRVLGIVSDRYKIVQNVEAFEFTDNIIGNGEIEVKYETAGALSNGTKVWLLAKMPKTTVLGDDVEPYLVFSNTFDGSGSIRVAMTPIRVVCQNTLSLALSNAQRVWNTKHMGNMEEKMHEAQITLGLAKKYMENFEPLAEQMEQITISPETLSEFMNAVFPIPTGDKVTARKDTNAKFIQSSFLRLYESIPDIEKFRYTGWGLYNAVSDFVSHMTPLRNTSTLAEKRFMGLVDGNKTLQQTQDFILNL